VRPGLFGVRFFPVRKGEFKVAVKIDGNHVQNSPFILTSESKQSEEDLLDLLDGNPTPKKEGPNKKVLDTAADSSSDTTHINEDTSLDEDQPKSSGNNTTPKPSTLRPKSSSDFGLSPISFADRAGKKWDANDDADDADGEVDDSIYKNDESFTFGKKEAAECEPTQVTTENEGDTSFDNSEVFSRKVTINKTASKIEIPVAPTQIVEGGDTEIDTEAESESDGGDKPTTTTTTTMRNGDNSGKRKRVATGYSDAETERETSSDDGGGGVGDGKNKGKKDNGERDKKKTRAPSMDSPTLPY